MGGAGQAWIVLYNFLGLDASCYFLSLQAIEKRSPRQSPVTESQGHGPSIKAVAKEVAADRAVDRSDSPPQRGL